MDINAAAKKEIFLMIYSCEPENSSFKNGWSLQIYLVIYIVQLWKSPDFLDTYAHCSIIFITYLNYSNSLIK